MTYNHNIKAFEYGGPTATRTRDQLIKSQLLYQLSYRPWRVYKKSIAFLALQESFNY